MIAERAIGGGVRGFGTLKNAYFCSQGFPYVFGLWFSLNFVLARGAHAKLNSTNSEHEDRDIC